MSIEPRDEATTVLVSPAQAINLATVLIAYANAGEPMRLTLGHGEDVVDIIIDPECRR